MFGNKIYSLKVVVLSLLLCSMVSVSCTKGNKTGKSTYDYFSTHLKADMNYPDIVNVFGEPDEDIGSGIHIYVYRLTDGTAIWVGFTDRIVYARHVDSNQQVLHIII